MSYFTEANNLPLLVRTLNAPLALGPPHPPHYEESTILSNLYRARLKWNKIKYDAVTCVNFSLHMCRGPASGWPRPHLAWSYTPNVLSMQTCSNPPSLALLHWALVEVLEVHVWCHITILHKNSTIPPLSFLLCQRHYMYSLFLKEWRPSMNRSSFGSITILLCLVQSQSCSWRCLISTWFIQLCF
jgi:hypothetical protein